MSTIKNGELGQRAYSDAISLRNLVLSAQVRAELERVRVERPATSATGGEDD